MNVKDLQKTAPNTVELTIEVDAPTMQQSISAAYKKNAGKISIPGFRKGKAPLKMIEQYYGEEIFYEDAFNQMWPEIYRRAIIEKDLYPVDNPEIEIESISHDGCTFKATVTVRPEVKLGNYKNLKVEKTIYPIQDTDIESELENMRQQAARIISVDDRKSLIGDTVVFDFDGYIDEVPFEGGKSEKYTLVLGSNQFIPGFEEQLVDRAIGEEFDVNVTFPDDYHAEEVAGKDAVFKCKMHEIKKTELPDLDDELAKDVSEFDTLDELKADIKKQMHKQAAKHSDAELEGRLIENLISDMEVDIPQCMIDRQTEYLAQEFGNRAQQQGVDINQYLQMANMDIKAFQSRFTEDAVKQTKTRLALEEIARLEKIVPTEDDLAAEYRLLSENHGIELAKIKKMIPPQQIIEDVAVGLAIKLIKENAVVTEVDFVPPADETDESTKKAEKPKKTASQKKRTKKENPEEKLEEPESEPENS